MTAGFGLKVLLAVLVAVTRQILQKFKLRNKVVLSEDMLKETKLYEQN